MKKFKSNNENVRLVKKDLLKNKTNEKKYRIISQNSLGYSLKRQKLKHKKKGNKGEKKKHEGKEKQKSKTQKEGGRKLKVSL